MNIRRYKPGDEGQIQSLFKKTFRSERSLEEWEWKFKHNPEQPDPFILLFEEDGRILGHISLWVSKAYIQGEEKRIGLRIDTMVDPDARGKGVYKQLNEALLTEAEKEGIAYLYGFPAPKAKELFLKYTNATHLTDVPRFMFVKKPVALLASKLKPLKMLKPLDVIYEKMKAPHFTEDPKLEVKKISHCDEAFDKLAEKTRSQTDAQLVRNATYLNWRYFSHPKHDYTMNAVYRGHELQGYVVTRSNDKGAFHNGLIVDWLAVEDPLVWDALLKAAFRELKQADVIQTWALEHTLPAQILKNYHFTHKDNPMPLVGKEVDDHMDKLNDASKWYITLGDVDSF
ncbi:GNAT family N-acetyltransferase [Halobacillus yeomjeoni]|uniref:GNAT family N-acetyltransferase n=1 Tax=Halobacillus yeomjeoni TaxID=311194 RepID=A0A931HWI3_9BACI|nr:GNAT family N-acetyltransferase [Halobacillus yeomjeoni]MBH0230708.1 GNAT family N-acetyltransferase [Halobacillus yeomjeoni]